MKLTFYGATETVTGSRFLLEDDNDKILIDCGMFQGLKNLRLKNWDKFPFRPSEIDNVLLTHAHIDHSGMLPALVKDGYEGKIFSSAATNDLCNIMLPDSARLHEEDARRANRYNYSKHSPAKPLYTEEDAQLALERFFPCNFGKKYQITENLDVEFIRAGHILGASSIRVSDGQTSIVFSGDLGRIDDPIIMPPSHIEEADYLVLESTYGDRLHEKCDVLGSIGEIINKTTSRGGTVLIPAFAVGRAQNILYYIYQLKSQGIIPRDLPIYLDSPMSINVTGLLHQNMKDHRLNKTECDNICNVARYIRTTEESKMLNQEGYNMPSVIISASGMATGGRVLHHMKRLIEDHRNTILFAGYQAAGTRGKRLVEGEEEIKIHGDIFNVKATISNLSNMSAHADYQEIINWLKNFRKQPRKVFLVHGENNALLSLKEHIVSELGWDVVIPRFGNSYDGL